jgi:hypothetical protein
MEHLTGGTKNDGTIFKFNKELVFLSVQESFFVLLALP